jgi:hypothetical protein
MSQSLSHQYRVALEYQKKYTENLKKLSEELEVSLRNNLRQENESW